MGVEHVRTGQADRTVTRNGATMVVVFLKTAPHRHVTETPVPFESNQRGLAKKKLGGRVRVEDR
jgi:hypothetical protein